MNFAAETCMNFYFQKHYCGPLSLNNVHDGAKLNRDQTLNKFIRNTIENASGKIENGKKSILCGPKCGRVGPRPVRRAPPPAPRQ